MLGGKKNICRMYIYVYIHVQSDDEVLNGSSTENVNMKLKF